MGIVGAFFALHEKHPNHLQSGKRTFHTLIPGMLMRDGKPYLALGSMGGEGQAQAALVARIVALADRLDLGHADAQSVARRPASPTRSFAS